MALRPAISRIVEQPIFEHNALFFVTPAGATAYTMRYRNVRAYAISASRFLEYNDAALFSKFDRRWKARTDSFWWSAIARRELDLTKRVVRSWAVRRLRIAFVESLKKAGYHKDGNPIDGSGKTAPLCGTAQLSPTQPILKIKLEALIKQTDLAVEVILRYQRPQHTTPSLVKGISISSVKGKRPGLRILKEKKPQQLKTEDERPLIIWRKI